MQGLQTAVRALCVLAFVTGLGDIVRGVGLLTLAGARLGDAANDPVLNSQIGFWGAMWFGFGLVLWRASSHLREEADLFRLLCGILLLSGLVRLGALIAYGYPGPVLTGALAVELIGGAGLLFWHASALKGPSIAAVPFRS